MISHKHSNDRFKSIIEVNPVTHTVISMNE